MWYEAGGATTDSKQVLPSTNWQWLQRTPVQRTPHRRISIDCTELDSVAFCSAGELYEPKMLCRVLKFVEYGVKCINVRQWQSAASSERAVHELPLTSDTVAPNSLVLRIQ